MRNWPLLWRELKSQSRNRRNYWLRVSGAAASLLIILSVFSIGNPNGQNLFLSVHAAIVFMLWMCVPVMTADAIAFEKREGTLGLLFLTGLGSRQIVAAKLFVHLLRAFTLMFASWPVLCLPIVYGGVSPADVATALVFECMIALLMVAAGLLASSISRAVLSTAILAHAFALFLPWLIAHLRALQFLAWTAPGPGSDLWPFIVWISGLNGTWSGSAPPNKLFDDITLLLILALGLAAASGWFAARTIQRHWQDRPTPERMQRLAQFFVRTRLGATHLRIRLNRALDRNPIAWLQKRSWRSRVIKWACCGLAMILVSWLIIPLGEFLTQFYLLALLVAAAIALSASGSFQNEKESGALELLLVTPLTEAKIIYGRVSGIWEQFGLVTGFLIFCWVFAATSHAVSVTHTHVNALLFLILSYLVVPVVGLSFAFRHNNLVSWLLTFLLATVSPVFLGEAAEHLLTAYLQRPTGSASTTGFFITTFVMIGEAMACTSWLSRQLKQRT